MAAQSGPTHRRSTMNRAGRRRPPPAYALLGLNLFQGLSGLGGGFGLMVDPTGTSMQIPLEWLEGSPFGTYLLPGLILFVVLGIAPLVVAFGVSGARPWSWVGSLLVGGGVLIWLGVEIAIVGFQAWPPLQLIYALVGVGILVLALVPSVRAYLLEPGGVRE